MTAVSAATRLIALLGDPVAHSLSPVFQNAAFSAAGVDGVYVALRAPAEEVPGLIRGIALSGGGGNVTLPHKELAARAIDRPTDAVSRTGACNTFWAEGGQVCGDNTDVAGVAAAMLRVVGAPPTGARVLLLGAGGSARAVVAALVDGSVGRLELLNRTPERAAPLLALAAEGGVEAAFVSDPARTRGERFDLIVNATSLGIREGDPLPLDPAVGVDCAAVLDLVYSRRSTAWVRAWTERGVPAADGLDMLVAQGAASFERWWGRQAPLDEMYRSLGR